MKFDYLLGKTIRFNSLVDECEIDFDKGMQAKIISVKKCKHDETIFEILVDFSEFEEINKQFGQANYYDEEQKPRLFWWETNSYPKDKREKIYLDTRTEKYPFPFEIVEELSFNPIYSEKIKNYSLDVLKHLRRIREEFEIVAKLARDGKNPDITSAMLNVLPLAEMIENSQQKQN